MAKSKFIQIRVSERLKERYMLALKDEGKETGVELNATDHLTIYIHKYAEEREKKKQKPDDDAVLRLLSEMQNAEINE